jgi:archaemetzincin
LVIQIQPFGNFPEEDQQYVYNAIKKHYPYVSLIKPLPLPKKAFYAKRNRYKADSLLTFLSSRTGEGEVIIGLTEKDISTTKDKVKDWGILGLGLCPGKSCVASTYRLSKEKRQEQLFKVCIHELGHTQGLKHCPVEYCYMHDAEGRNTTDEETDFCPDCKAVLKAKGWRF